MTSLINNRNKSSTDAAEMRHKTSSLSEENVVCILKTTSSLIPMDAKVNCEQ